MPPVYLDYNATTPMDPRVFDAMRPWLLQPANAGSRAHWYGQQAKQAVDDARAEVAKLLGAESEEIIFTSGATESNNLAILGLAEHGLKCGRRHVISTTIEHKAVLEPLERLASLGFDVELAPVTAGGYVEPAEIRSRLRPDTLLVSVMHANNETGVIQPIEEIAANLADTKVLFHTDAAQTFGKELDTLKRVSADFVSISGHKLCGPQGIGALYIRRRPGQPRPLSPLLFGGGQERGLRPGTVPVALAVGLGIASQIATADSSFRNNTAAALKQRFLSDLAGCNHTINGDPARTQPHVVNIRLPGVDSEALMLMLRDAMAISNGAACTVATYRPSHVLRAMGLSDEAITQSVRFSWGPDTAPIDTSPLLHCVTSVAS